jgi:hypothetical protein
LQTRCRGSEQAGAEVQRLIGVEVVQSRCRGCAQVVQRWYMQR